ncbi:MAG: hypothetical protein KJ011_11915 [Burkholderiaceae bacterium]|nr:hypothetical protein [Burkholderiaceae bacterium]
MLLLGLFAAAALVYWIAQGWPQRVAEPGAAAGDERIACLSYAPFRRPGQTPLDPTARVSRAQIEADLRILATRTGCVRTYSVDQGLDQVPAVARELGMTVLLGAWLGRDRERNRKELALAVALARAESPVVRALVVGNEVLLRRELPEHALRASIVQARQALRDAAPGGAAIPVTYADVWEFWLEHPGLADAVDFVTIHVLPYWEDEPVGIDQAVAHVVATYRLAQAALPGREILLGETGWPRAGRARRAATAGRVEQARFVREFVRTARIEGLPYNLIEAFDQPWKRRLEGAMGGHWGLFDSAGVPAFPWHGRVEADPHWRTGLWGGAAGALGFTLLAAVSRTRLRAMSAAGDRAQAQVSSPARAVLAHALAGFAVGALAVAQWRHAVAWQRDGYEWLVALAGLLSSALFGWLAAARLFPFALRAGVADGVDTGPGTRASLPGIHALLSGHAGRPHRMEAATLLGALRFAFLFAAAFSIVLLVFDARYRSFPWPFFAAPLGAALLLALQGERLPADAREERALGVVAALGAPLVLAFETLANREALVFLCGLLLYVAACFGRPSRSGRVPGEDGTRTSTSSPSSAPNADGSNE